MRRFPWQAGVLGVILVVLGCGSGASTYEITGAVKYDGQPVEDGEIIFVPVEKDKAPDAGRIRNGTYRVQVKGGSKRVEIRASRELPEKRTPMGPVFQQYIPECYNAQSRLTAEITADGKKQWDFDLEKEAK